MPSPFTSLGVVRIQAVVVYCRRLHVLDQRSSVEDVQQLMAAADAEQRQAGVDSGPGNIHVQVVLLGVHIIKRLVRVLSIEAWVDVAASRQHNAVERLHLGGQAPGAVSGNRGQQHWLCARFAQEVHDVRKEVVGFTHTGVGIARTTETYRNADARTSNS